MEGRRVRLSVVMLVVGSARLLAQDQAEKTKSFVADFGFVNAAGNTSVTAVNLGDKFVVNTRDKKIIFTQLFGAVYGSTEGEKTAENYRAQLRLDYGLAARWYLFALTGWDRNPFGGVARRFEETAGVAWKVLPGPRDELTFETGLSLVQQRNTVPIGGELDDNFTAARLAGLFRHAFTESTLFTQTLEFMPSFDDGDDWRLNSESAIVAPISTHIGLKVSYVIRFDNLPGLVPPPNPLGERLEKADRFLTAGLTVSY